MQRPPKESRAKKQRKRKRRKALELYYPNTQSILAHAGIFDVVARHLDFPSIGVLAQTSKRLNRLIIAARINHPAGILSHIGSLSRIEAAQFFHVYGGMLADKAVHWLNVNPDDDLAYALSLLTLEVTLIKHNPARMARILQFFRDHEYPQRIIDAISFIQDFLTRPKNEFATYLVRETDFYINLCGADLSGIDIHLDAGVIAAPNFNLIGANLSGACFDDSDFSGQNLTYADLRNAMCLTGNFRRCVLFYANLRGVLADPDYGQAGNSVFSDAVFFFAMHDPEEIEDLLNHYAEAMPFGEYLLRDITADFVRAADQAQANNMEFLDQGENHPLFATHHDPVVAWISKYIGFFTGAQKTIEAQKDRIARRAQQP